MISLYVYVCIDFLHVHCLSNFHADDSHMGLDWINKHGTTDLLFGPNMFCKATIELHAIWTVVPSYWKNM
jgi:hypothetical protein